MSDEQMTTTPVAESKESATEGAKPGVFSTPTGRILGIVGGLVVLGVIAGIAATIFLTSIAGDVGDGLLTPPATPSESGDGSGTTTDTVEAASPAAEVAYSEVFTFRNIFEPLLKPLPEPAAPTTSTATPSTTDTETPYAQGVLYLNGIETVDGVMKAVLSYNGQTYTLGPGEGIPGTPWEVFSVTSSSVTMLYGDVRVTLAVGQGISK
ncbi:MAG: hypothetical protein JW733_06750 [Coriobacteriia bacterium]|nr:hypothetical protein [Coriobacteriia bacterium]